MNKSELIKHVASEIGVTEKLTAQIVNATFRTIKESLYNEKDVQLSDFGRFSVQQRTEYVGKNPRTGDEMTIPARKSPIFKSCRKFKVMLNKEQ